MSKFDVSHLNIGSVGSLPLRIPVVTIGSGEPILSVLCGLHGDETASTFSAHRFMKRLAEGPELHGTVRLIPAANPFAQATRTRVTVTDWDNLNRTGKGDAAGRLTQRIGNRLFEFLKDSALVIDLHEFRMRTPRMVVYIPTENKEIEQINLANIAAFEPAFVWALTGASSDSGSLVGALIGAGVPGFGVETSDALVISDEEIERVVAGLCRVAQNLGLLPGTPRTEAVTAYNTRLVSAEQAGIWHSSRALFETVEAGETIGELIPFPLIDAEPVVTPQAGVLVQLLPRQLVDTGSYLFAVGQVNQEISDKLRATAPRNGQAEVKAR
jgi:predicted deacylase